MTDGDDVVVSMDIPSHIPDGMMCYNCVRRDEKCNHLDFTKMKPIKQLEDCKVVRCIKWEKRNG